MHVGRGDRSTLLDALHDTEKTDTKDPMLLQIQDIEVFTQLRQPPRRGLLYQVGVSSIR